MKICISGSRDFKSLYKIKTVLAKLPADTTIVHGSARGVDMEADSSARQLGLQVEVYPADWDKYGKSAGHIRNKEMVIKCDGLIAFWDGMSKGTAGAIQCAKELGKPVVIYKDC